MKPVFGPCFPFDRTTEKEVLTRRRGSRLPTLSPHQLKEIIKTHELRVVPGYSIPWQGDGIRLTPLELQEGCIIYTTARAPPQTPSSGTYAQPHEDFTPNFPKMGARMSLNAFPRVRENERERERKRERESE